MASVHRVQPQEWVDTEQGCWATEGVHCWSALLEQGQWNVRQRIPRARAAAGQIQDCCDVNAPG